MRPVGTKLDDTVRHAKRERLIMTSSANGDQTADLYFFAFSDSEMSRKVIKVRLILNFFLSAQNQDKSIVGPVSQ